MKTNYILTAVFVAATMLTACEKDKMNPTNKSAISDSKTTKTIKNNEKLSSLETDLSNFISDIHNGVDPSSELPIRGLLFEESALNYIVNSFDEDPGFQKPYEAVLDISDFITAANVPGNNVSGSQLTDFYEQVYNKIDAVADTAQLEGTGNKYVTSIDISFDENNLSAGASVIFTLGKNLNNPYVCTLDGDYSILSRIIGPCNNHSNPGSRTGENANDQVSRLVGANCNSNVGGCPRLLPNYSSWYNVQTIPNSSTPNFNTAYNYYVTTNPIECVKQSTISSIVSSIKTWQSNNYPKYLVPPKVALPIGIKRAFTINHIWTDASFVNHYAIKLYTVEAQCLNISLPQWPRPNW